MANVEFYETMKQLQKHQHYNEKERMKLEHQLNTHVRSDKRIAKLQAAKLQAYWKKICDDEKRSQTRNQQILKDLERVESHLASLSAKTERLRILKTQYEDYIERMYPQWQQRVLMEEQAKQHQAQENRNQLDPSFAAHYLAPYSQPPNPQPTNTYPLNTQPLLGYNQQFSTPAVSIPIHHQPNSSQPTGHSQHIPLTAATHTAPHLGHPQTRTAPPTGLPQNYLGMQGHVDGQSSLHSTAQSQLGTVTPMSTLHSTLQGPQSTLQGYPGTDHVDHGFGTTSAKYHDSGHSTLNSNIHQQQPSFVPGAHSGLPQSYIPGAQTLPAGYNPNILQPPPVGLSQTQPKQPYPTHSSHNKPHLSTSPAYFQPSRHSNPQEQTHQNTHTSDMQAPMQNSHNYTDVQAQSQNQHRKIHQTQSSLPPDESLDHSPDISTDNEFDQQTNMAPYKRHAQDVVQGQQEQGQTAAKQDVTVPRLENIKDYPELSSEESDEDSNIESDLSLPISEGQVSPTPRSKASHRSGIMSPQTMPEESIHQASNASKNLPKQPHSVSENKITRQKAVEERLPSPRGTDHEPSVISPRSSKSSIHSPRSSKSPIHSPREVGQGQIQSQGQEPVASLQSPRSSKISLQSPRSSHSSLQSPRKDRSPIQSPRSEKSEENSPERKSEKDADSESDVASPRGPELTLDGMYTLIQEVQGHILVSHNNHEHYYRCEMPAAADRKQIINCANTKQSLSKFKAPQLSMVVLHELPSVVGQRKGNCVLTEKVLTTNRPIKSEMDVRSFIYTTSLELWDTLYDHFTKLIERQILTAGEVGTIFGPLLVIERSPNSDKAANLLASLLDKVSVIAESEESSIFSESPVSPKREIEEKDNSPVPPLKIDSPVSDDDSSDDDFFGQTVPPTDASLTQTDAYKSLVGGTSTKKQPTIEVQNDDESEDDLEKQMASMVSPRSKSERKPSLASLSHSYDLEAPRSPKSPSLLSGDESADASSVSPGPSPGGYIPSTMERSGKSPTALSTGRSAKSATFSTAKKSAAFRTGSDIESESEMDLPISGGVDDEHQDDFDFYD